MIAQYSFEKRIQNNELSSNGYPNPSCVFDTFQKAASEHAESAGFGFEEMSNQGMIWVLTKLRYEVYKKISAEELCTVKTFPFEMRSLLVERDYYIYDSRNEMVVKGAGQWCLLDINSRKIVRKPLKFSDEHISVPAFDNPFPRIKKTMFPICNSYVVSKDDIDDNGHMNNCCYAKLAYAFSELDDVLAMTTNFEMESFEGDELYFGKIKENGKTTLLCYNNVGKVVFSALME